MNKLPASTGWLWIKQGFQYFRKQPSEFSMLFLSYIFLMLILGIIPVLGQIVAFLLLPALTLSFMQACKVADEGQRIHPRLLFYGVRHPKISQLVTLGLLYLVAAGVALGISTLVDGGAFFAMISGQSDLNETAVANTSVVDAMLVTLLVYLPAQMAFWFAAPLMVWQDMSIAKAMFYSFFATLKLTPAFLVYGLGWFFLSGVVPLVLSVIIALVSGDPHMAIYIVMPISMLITLVMFCSFYPSYHSIFVQAESSDPPPAEPKDESSTIS